MEWLFCPISVRFKEKTCMEIQKLLLFFIEINSSILPLDIVLSFKCSNHLWDILNECGTWLNGMIFFIFPFDFKRRFLLVDQWFYDF